MLVERALLTGLLGHRVVILLAGSKFGSAQVRNYLVKNVATSGSAARLSVINYAFANVAPDSSGNVLCKLADDWADYQKPWSPAESVNGSGTKLAAVS